MIASAAAGCKRLLASSFPRSQIGERSCFEVRYADLTVGQESVYCGSALNELFENGNKCWFTKDRR